jgi:3-hydroxyacyl-CoA dehydrogenase
MSSVTPVDAASNGAPPGSIAIVGAGSIGVAWAVVFTRAGRNVTVHDPDPERLALATGEVRERLTDLREAGLLEESPDAIVARLTPHAELDAAVADAIHVQECAPEYLEVKRDLFERLDSVASPSATLATSSSAITVSAFARELPGRDRCLVVHPANPPHLLPIAEIVPAAFTRADVVDRTEALLRAAGMSPVRVRTEIEGFIFNRLQGAVLREAYCLVRDGVASVEDIDRTMRDGIGRRWALIGPFEATDLNTRGGLATHALRMGPAYERMGNERGQHDPWTPDLVARVVAERRALLPLDQWEARVRWRDRGLMALERARRAIEPFPDA